MQFNLSKEVGELSAPKRCPMGCTYLSGCWVPQVFGTKEHEDESNEQHAEEQPANPVPGAGLLSGLGCFCLDKHKRTISRVLPLLPVGRGHEHTGRTLQTHVQKATVLGAVLRRPSHDLGAGCSLYARTSSRGGVTQPLGCTCSKAGFLRLR